MRAFFLGLSLFVSACGGPFFGCGPAPRCEVPRVVGVGNACGTDTCQVCGEGLFCAAQGESTQMRCFIDDPVAPDLSPVGGTDLGHGDLPDLASVDGSDAGPDGGSSDADLERVDAGQADGDTTGHAS